MATAASAVPGGSVDLALEGGTVIVTVAGSGIGAATARLLGAAERAARSSEGSFADRVFGDLQGETALEDDLALLAIEAVPLGRVLQLSLDADARVLSGLRRAKALASQQFSPPGHAASWRPRRNAPCHADGAQNNVFVCVLSALRRGNSIVRCEAGNGSSL